MGIVQTVKSIKPAFWLANGMEACERLAYFGIRAILPLMMVSTGVGGLGLSMGQKGIILGMWALIQCIVPMVSGGFSESFGYKKSLIVAFIVNLFGYLLMANIRELATMLTGSAGIDVTVNFVLMLVAGCTIGVGTAIFKPPVGGVVAQSLNDKNSGFGFGLFYWVVNIGGFLAPMLASALRGTEEAPTWSYVFYGAAAVTVLNLVITILFFKEPSSVVPEAEKLQADKDQEIASDDRVQNASETNSENSDASLEKNDTVDAQNVATKKEKASETSWQVFVNTLGILWNDKMMLCFLLIVSGFWLMFMQLWDLLPNFLDEWVDRRGVGALLSGSSFFAPYLESNGALKPEIIINIDSATIILLVLPLSAFFQRYKMMTSLILGMVISVIGFLMSGMFMSGEIVCIAVFIFAIGEIICSPKFDEYVGMTAPADKKAIYMGFVNIPFAVGWAFGNFLSGPLYEAFSSKTMLATRYLVEHGENAEALAKLSQEDLMQKVQNVAGVTDVYQANQVLWDAYSPWIIWIILGAVGVASMIGMIAFYYKSGMAAKDNAKNNDKDPGNNSSDAAQVAA